MSRTWEQQGERGSAFMMKLLLAVTRVAGRRVTQWLARPIALYFLVTAGAARQASRDYLRRVLARKPGWRDVARHFRTFASVSMDRFFLLGSGAQAFDVRLQVPAQIDALSAQGRGCVLLLAHLGGYEPMRAAAGERKLPLRILLDLAVGRKLMSTLSALNPQLAAQVIDASDRGPALVLRLREALEQGAFVGMMADRATADERALQAEFLGGQARFAVGPWLLASASAVPVFLAFGLYRGGNRYDLHFESFSDRIVLPRGERDAALQNYINRYAARLEHYARLAPYNWFNFYDYWQTGSPR